MNRGDHRMDDLNSKPIMRAIYWGAELGAVISLFWLIWQLWSDRHFLGFGFSNLLQLCCTK